MDYSDNICMVLQGACMNHQIENQEGLLISNIIVESGIKTPTNKKLMSMFLVEL